MKKFLKISLLVLLVASIVAPAASAIVPYTTYVYDIDGVAVESPHAYVPDTLIDSERMDLIVPLDDPTDIVVDSAGYVFIADARNDRVVILDPTYKAVGIVQDFFNAYNIYDSLSNPNGVFVSGDRLYVADTDNSRVVVFRMDFALGRPECYKKENVAFENIIEAPQSDVFPEGSIYRPVAVAVDIAGRVYVVSSTTNYGVISLNADGTFIGFLGAQKTSPTAWQIFWRNFQTRAQRAQTEKLVPTEYNNITIDESGFIYVTTNSINDSKQNSSLTSKTAEYAPVKKLNPSGNDVMLRTGFFAPGGEVEGALYVKTARTDATIGASSITDAAIGPSGMWTILDSLRQKYYTYDQQGNLMFVFGDKGSQIGNTTNASSITYKGSDILVLDKNTDSITVFKRTQYGDMLAAALQNQLDRNWSESEKYWTDILQRNLNFDESYIGIGDSLYRAGKYEKSLEYYKAAYDTEGYSTAYKQIRKQWMSKYIIVIPIFLIVFFVALSLFFRYTRKFNEAGQVMKEKRSWWEQVVYGFHIIFHPFDGYWDMKHEKRGGLKGAITILVFAILGFIYNDVGKAFIYNPYQYGISFIWEILSIVVPLALWVVANWCLTTLFDGEGSIKDILTASCYALLPLPLMMIPATLLTNVLSADESAIVSLIVTIGYIWAAMLLFFGSMIIHDYTLSKNIVITLFTIVGMAFIMFVGVLFSGLVTKLFSFFYNIYTELALRF